LETKLLVFLQRCRTSGALKGPNLCDYVFYVGYVGYVVKNIFVICVENKPQPFWRTRILPIDVYPAKTWKRNYLQRCLTSGALEGPNLCDYVSYVNYVVKNIFVICGKNKPKPFWRTLTISIDVYSAKTRKRNHWCSYKDVAPLVLWKGFEFVWLCFLCGLCG
jgi:hypothetical protein